MDMLGLESAIVSRGRQLNDMIGNEVPSVFNANRWINGVMDWCMSHDDFKIQLFRFIDVLPYLNTDEALISHIQEYFAKDQNIPTVLRLGAKTTKLGGKLLSNVLGKVIRKNLEIMALQFIIGRNVDRTIKNLKKLRDKHGFAFTLDILGEATISEPEASEYVAEYLSLLDGINAVQNKWKPLGSVSGDLDWGHAPKCDISIKPSALYCKCDPADFEGTVSSMLEMIKPVYRKVIKMGASMCIDIETKQLREVTFELFRRLRSDAEFRHYKHLGIAMQLYLKDHEHCLDEMLSWSRKEALPFIVRLVKGAYWDYEIVIARQNGWEVPVYSIKAHSDIAFENAVRKVFINSDICYLACASHNIRTVSATMELAKAMNIGQDRYEFQILYGMAEPFRKAMLKMTPNVRLYCPHGQLLPGMAYLIRRLMENTSNESFLKQSFVDGVDIDKLLEDPNITYKNALSKKQADEPKKGFSNEPLVDFSEVENRHDIENAIKQVRTTTGKTYPLYINGTDITTDDIIDSVNPANPQEVIGKICQAGTQQVQIAIDSAENELLSWRDVPAPERAEYLFKAAKIARKRIYELSARQVLEAGKQWRQAYNDVAEAIDFLNYYAHEMIRIDRPRYMGNAPGEVNQYYYQPKGVTAVISPWNFPLAISCGMCAAAIVTGNTVVFKPSNQTPVIGYDLKQLFEEAGLPAGVFNYCPGRGSVMGDYLVDHPKIAMIAFTGSMEVGLRIIERAAKTPDNQPSVKKVIAEMGGKNAIIIDDDADLDEAVPAVLDSAFTYQGQKCSACSRVIVLESVYDRFISRLIPAAKAIKVGPAEDPSYHMGAVIDKNARSSILNYAAIAVSEGNLLYSSQVPQDGFYCPVTIVDGITPEHQIAQKEVFGPVLAVMKVKDFDQALDWANSTRFALTGAVFTRNPQHIDFARERFRVGNLYINRGSTGALVQRQPFGGFKMSGIGSKAGGPDYLLQFMDPRTVTENTMRRGFVPVRTDDQWV